MDHSNPSTSWYHSQFDTNQPIHQPINPHLDPQSLASPITQYRPHPPVNHQQFHPAHHPPADAGSFSSTNLSQYPIGPFPQDDAIPEWTQWDPALSHQGGGGPTLFASHGQPDFDHSPAIDLYNIDPMANWRAKQQQTQSRPPLSGGASNSSYTAFSAFLTSTSSSQSSTQQTQSQQSSAPQSPAVSPLHRPIPLAHRSPPPLINRSHSYTGVPAPARSNLNPNSTNSSGAYAKVNSPSRPGVQYHTEPTRRAPYPLSARSMPSDWQAAYAHSLAEQRVRAQSTSHIPLTTGTPPDWSNTPATSQPQPDSFSFLGLNLGDERRLGPEQGGSSSSEGGMSDWAPGLVGAEHWQNQTVPPTDLNSTGMVAGRFENEYTHPHLQPAHELAGPSTGRYDSPALGPRLESLDLAPNESPKSRGSSQLSTPKSVMSTSFSAYDPAAEPSEGRKGRVPRRRPNEPPRNPNMRRYPCPLCVVTPRTFARPSALKIHMLTHTKEKREWPIVGRLSCESVKCVR